jgi:predicted enzyme related to lactoylglutathione lyase
MAPVISAVLVHVPDVEAGLRRYQRAFPTSERKRLEAFDFEYLCVGDIKLEIVPSDEKVSSGAAGSVVYWYVSNFEGALTHFESLGARLYRGPMDIEEGWRMCQVRDPWGNCIGLRGPGGAAPGQGHGAEV